MKYSGSTIAGQDEFSQLGLSSGHSHEHCTECNVPCDQLRMAWGVQMCPDCFEKYFQSEQADGGPFTVTIWELESFFTKNRIAKEYEFRSLSEAEGFAKTWLGKITNQFGVEILNYETK